MPNVAGFQTSDPTKVKVRNKQTGEESEVSQGSPLIGSVYDVLGTTPTGQASLNPNTPSKSFIDKVNSLPDGPSKLKEVLAQNPDAMGSEEGRLLALQAAFSPQELLQMGFNPDLGNVVNQRTQAQQNLLGTAQPTNSSIGVLEQALKAKSGVGNLPLGTSEGFKAAGLPTTGIAGAAILNQSLAERAREIQRKGQSFTQAIRDVAGAQLDQYKLAKNKYDLINEDYQNQIKRLQQLDDEERQTANQLFLYEEQARINKEIKASEPVEQPSIEDLIDGKNAGFIFEDGEWKEQTLRGKIDFNAAGKSKVATYSKIYGGSSKNAEGVDFAGKRGSAITASSGGQVIKRVMNCKPGDFSCNGGWGNQVIVEDEFGNRHAYNHLDSLSNDVHTGDFIESGTILGGMGNTGDVLTTSGSPEGRSPTQEEANRGLGTHLDYTVYDPEGNKYSLEDALDFSFDSEAFRGELSLEDKIIAGNLAVDIFGKRAAEKWMPIIEDLMLEGKSGDDIRDLLRDAKQSEAFVGSAFEDATRSIAGNLSFAGGELLLDDIDRRLEAGDVFGAKERLKKGAQDSVSVDEAKAIRGKSRTVEFLNEVERDLAGYIVGGGDTNIFVWTEENIANKVGETARPELRNIATKIQTAIQGYRKSLSGVAFSEPESIEYRDMFPSVGRSPEFNMANIEALRETMEGDVRRFYSDIMGLSEYEELFEGDPIIYDTGESSSTNEEPIFDEDDKSFWEKMFS